MRFALLVTDEDCLRAEQDIERAVAEREAAIRAAAAPARPSDGEARPVVAPEIRTSRRDAGLGARLLAKIGCTARARRAEVFNSIGRTVDLACANGLADQSSAQGTKAFEMVARLYESAKAPGKSSEDLMMVLGWTQAVVTFTCRGLSATAIRSA
jgi:hypothetical protein